VKQQEMAAYAIDALLCEMVRNDEVDEQQKVQMPRQGEEASPNEKTMKMIRSGSNPEFWNLLVWTRGLTGCCPRRHPHHWMDCVLLGCCHC
jgi:hypothetical protein